MAKGRAGRTYTRDSRGRFASSGSTGRQRPASRPAPRGRNRLTRDNSGRITGTGDGATARGGRLRTGAGNLRATQTARLKGQGGKVRRPMGGGGVKVAKAGGGASVVAAKPVRVRGNFRPQGVMGAPLNTAKMFGKTKRENIAIAEGLIKKAGYTPFVDKKRSSEGVASTVRGMSYIKIVKNSPFWSDPHKHAKQQRRMGHWSSSNPAAVIYHEIGHQKDRRPGKISDATKPWGIGPRPFLNERNAKLARRVSNYATHSSPEFVAEAYAGRRVGQKYDNRVMRAYRQEIGLPGIRTGSRVAPGGAALASPSAVVRDRARRRRKPKP